MNRVEHKGVDMVLLFAVVALSLVGIVIVYSASYGFAGGAQPISMRPPPRLAPDQPRRSTGGARDAASMLDVAERVWCGDNAEGRSLREQGAQRRERHGRRVRREKLGDPRG